MTLPQEEPTASRCRGSGSGVAHRKEFLFFGDCGGTPGKPVICSRNAARTAPATKRHRGKSVARLGVKMNAVKCQNQRTHRLCGGGYREIVALGRSCEALWGEER
jgi:hypothetical protein